MTNVDENGTAIPEDTDENTKLKKEVGEQLIRSGTAQGAPGEKQPAHIGPQEALELAPKYLTSEMIEESLKPRESSAARSQRPGNEFHIPPHERTISDLDRTTSLGATAAHMLAGAVSQAQSDATAQARLESDPRYERDLKVLELGKRGKLGAVPPTDAEVAANAERTGLSADVAEKIPTTAEEQVAQDMPRLEAAERAITNVPTTAPIEAGENPEPKNDEIV